MIRGAAVMAVAAGMYGASVLAGQSQQIQMPPLTLVVVVDVTASMDPSEQVTLVVSGLGGLLEPGDRVRLGRIARTVAFGPWFAAPDSVAEAARVLEAPEGDQLGPSPIWDATDEALRLLEREDGRRAVIVWTDGRASGNLVGRFDVARRAQAAGVPIHVISPPTELVLRQTETTAVRVRPGVYLEWLAETTGGLFRVAMPEPNRPLGDPLEALGEILDVLRHTSD